MSEPVAVTFGRYSLIRRIARGGMAEIFLAKQQGPGRFERSLVIKRILPHLVAEGSQFTQMFLDEASLAAQLQHPHIAQVYDFGQEAGSYYLALELVKGPDLRGLIRTAQKLQAPPPPIELSVRIMAEVLGALDYAHRAMSEAGQALNIVHRDVSPQNVLVSYDGVAKLVDFGIAKAATASTETEAGVVKGKYAYFAPEQIKKVPLDGRTDMYAAALVLYELLTLKQALLGEGLEALMAAVESRITPILEVRPDLPHDLVRVLEKALDRDRDKRYPSCREFQAELEALLVGWGVAVTPHDIAGYIQALEAQNGEPLSAAVITQGHTPAPLYAPIAAPAPAPPRAPPAPAPAEGDSTRRNLGAFTEDVAPRPAPSPRPRTGQMRALTSERPAVAPRQKTGTRPALDPAGLDTGTTEVPRRLKTGARPAIDPELDAGPTAPPGQFRAVPDDDDDDATLTPEAPPTRRRSNPGQRAIPPAEVPVRRRTNPAQRALPIEEPQPEKTASTTRPDDVGSRKKKGGSGGVVFLALVILLGGAGGLAWHMGLRVSDLRGVHSLDELSAVLQAKLGDAKPAPLPVEATPLPKPPPPPLLPTTATAEPAPAEVPSTPPPEKPAEPAPTAAPVVVAAKPVEEPPRHPRKTHPKTEHEAAAPVVAAPVPVEPVAAAPVAPTTGSVLFEIRPWANVKVGTHDLGQSPLPPEELPAGSYTADLSNPAVDHVVHKAFTVTAGQQITVRVDMTKE